MFDRNKSIGEDDDKVQISNAENAAKLKTNTIDFATLAKTEDTDTSRLFLGGNSVNKMRSGFKMKGYTKK